MHIAICLWGIFRSSDYTYTSFKHNILDTLTSFGFTYDILLHTYIINHEYVNARSRERASKLDNDKWKMYFPDKFIIDEEADADEIIDLLKYRTQPDPWGSSFKDTTFDNHIHSLYSLKRVTSLWSNSDISYNAILYVRPDVRFLYPLQKEWFDSDRLLYAQIPNFSKFPINDRFLLGGPAVAVAYGNRFDEAYEYSLRKSLHSEIFLHFILSKYKIPIKEIDFNFKRIRITGVDGDPRIN